MPTAYIYWVTTQILNFAKIGYWTGDLISLYHRYVTYFGYDLEFVIFEFKTIDIRGIEARIQKDLKSFAYQCELFWKSTESLEAYLTSAQRQNNSLIYCSKLKRSPIKRTKAFMTKYKLSLQKKQQKFEDSILNYISKLFEDKDENKAKIKIEHKDLDYSEIPEIDSSQYQSFKLQMSHNETTSIIFESCLRYEFDNYIVSNKFNEDINIKANLFNECRQNKPQKVLLLNKFLEDKNDASITKQLLMFSKIKDARDLDDVNNMKILCNLLGLQNTHDTSVIIRYETLRDH